MSNSSPKALQPHSCHTSPSFSSPLSILPQARAKEAERAARAAFNEIAQLADAEEAGVLDLFQMEIQQRLPEGWELSSMGTAVPSGGARGGGGGGAAAGMSDAGEAMWAPTIGDRVGVKRLGTRPATVVEIGTDGWCQARPAYYFRCLPTPSPRATRSAFHLLLS